MSENTGTKHTAGAFDIRTFIAGLMGIFGVIILLAGIFGGDTTSDSTTNGSVINTWVGIGLIVFAALMQGWAIWRPTVVDEAQLAKDKKEGGPAH